MFVNSFIFASNPFIDSYLLSDFLGKCIFAALFMLSASSWILILHKGWQIYQAEKKSDSFQKELFLQKTDLLNADFKEMSLKEKESPFMEVYATLKNSACNILYKNSNGKSYANDASSESSCHYLSSGDVEFISHSLLATMTLQTRQLEKDLYLLSTVVSLAPFLGLLGTVWGILTTFSELQAHTGGGTHQMVLSGLSLALATTVIGLLDAIPALIGYNYLKNKVSDFEVAMGGFATELLASIEMQYRKIDV